VSSKAIAIIQARMSSSRLPGKVMKRLAGKPMIWHIVQRAKACHLVDEVVVATSSESSDDMLAEFCMKSKIKYHRGSLQNVLARYLEVLEDHPREYFVRITGDCPLIDPAFIDKQLLALKAHDGDLVWLNPSLSVFEGQGAHSTRALKLVAAKTRHPDDLEHVGSLYFLEHPQEFRVIGMYPPEALINHKWRITVDESKDYEMMEKLYESLWHGNPISLPDALEWLSNNRAMSESNMLVRPSTINRELTAKREDYKRHVEFYCEWNNPSELVASMEHRQP
jgi:spore coat polysaccharide biosynthesis protein SpsF